MKHFLAVFTGSAEAMARWATLSEAERAARQTAGMAAWRSWMEAHADSVVEPGAPLGRTKKASLAGITNTKNELAGYVVVRAESHDAAVRLFEGHPHFAIFPGEGVEVMECLPIPSA